MYISARGSPITEENICLWGKVAAMSVLEFCFCKRWPDQTLKKKPFFSTDIFSLDYYLSQILQGQGRLLFGILYYAGPNLLLIAVQHFCS